MLDFGCWSRNERLSLRWLAESVGAAYEVNFVPLDRATQLRRIERRWAQTPNETFPITSDEVDRWRAQFEVYLTLQS